MTLFNYEKLCADAWTSVLDWEECQYGWLKTKLAHRKDDVCFYCHNGTIIYSEFGFQHRKDGPAIMQNEPTRKDLWFIYGVEVTEVYDTLGSRN